MPESAPSDAPETFRVDRKDEHYKNVLYAILAGRFVNPTGRLDLMAGEVVDAADQVVTAIHAKGWQEEKDAKDAAKKKAEDEKKAAEDKEAADRAAAAKKEEEAKAKEGTAQHPGANTSPAPTVPHPAPGAGPTTL